MEFITMQKLFDNFGVDCPSWLSDDKIEDEWLNSDYTFENGEHKWEFQEFDMGHLVRHLILRYDGKECSLSYFVDGEFRLLNFWDEEGCFIT